MKNRLHCEVTSCQHYSNSQCCLEGIQVDGPAARQPDQTCCASYQERRPGAGSNAMGQSPSGESHIHCQAQHCTYNDGCSCGASSVQVGCCCGDVTSKSGTQCCTFQEK